MNDRDVTVPATPAALRARMEAHARSWDTALEAVFETEGSLIGHGRRRGRGVILKLVKQPGDEWRSGHVLAAFGGIGVVRVFEQADGAMLLERLDPGTSLTALALDGRDAEATSVLAGVIGAMSPSPSVTGFPTVHGWALGFERYRAAGNDRVPRHLVVEAERTYLALCASQASPRLLHGDLHHYNVLFDRHRGWVAIDPKGVVGEIEYEIGAALRNPVELPELFTDPATIERRLACFGSVLGIDVGRALGWSFAQAVLSCIWSIEDGHTVSIGDPDIQLAESMRAMLGAGGPSPGSWAG